MHNALNTIATETMSMAQPPLLSSVPLPPAVMGLLSCNTRRSFLVQGRIALLIHHYIHHIAGLGNTTFICAAARGQFDRK